MSLDTKVKSAELVLARYGELWLKGKNRHEFERRLARNVKDALEPIADVRVTRGYAQLEVRADRRLGEISRRLEEVFGIATISPAWGAEPNADAIVATSRTVMAVAMDALPEDRRIPFRVETRRSDKTFPLTSMELDRFVAEHVLPEFGERLKVDLSHPELTLGINVRTKRTFVFAERRPGAGGLPVGTVGRAVCLLSGGIDSPVAAWMAMKRGCVVAFLSFHSYPYLGESSKLKIVKLVRELARWQPRTRLYVAPFTEVQIAIRDHAPEPYRTVLYRRMMQRIAGRVARMEKAGAVVTGESLGQVASQTMENIACIQDAADLPVLRPLIGFDKTEAIALARRIGTYPISILPEPDCCTVFQPSKPVIRGRVERCARAEAQLDVEGLVARAVEGLEVVDV
ncbi:MAG: tRNA 4-thiouridine(8) synthase ThiI [Planctomycetota bacterium]|nr:tRNA 4-thiouridine(8) synthase ThiI [Planctomycetota bacterium]